VSASLLGAASFLTLEADGYIRATVDLEIRSPNVSPANLELHWAKSVKAFDERRAWKTIVPPGRSRHSVYIPADVNALRIELGERPLNILIHEVALRSRFGVALAQWNSRTGFRGWKPSTEVSRFALTPDGLEVETTGGEPRISIEGLTEVQPRRLKSNIGLAAVIGLLLGFAHAWLTAGLVSSGAGLPVGVAPATPLATLGSVILFVTSTALSAAAGYLVYERLLRPPRVGPDTSIGQHDLFLVDSRGRRLSEVPGDVAIVLDPFTGYRNAPRQETSRVTTDENGFRGGIPAGDRRLAMVVGGSAAFGFGLESDKETFAGVLNRLQSAYRVVNTGVTGFLSGQELSLMVHKLDDFHPKLYVVFDGWNDLFFTQSFPNLRLHDFGFNWPIWGDIENRLHDQYLSRAPVAQASTIPGLASPARGEAENLQGAIAAYIENLGRMKAFADARGARLVVIFQPELLSKRTPTKEEVSLRKEFLDWAARPRVKFDAARFSSDYRMMIGAAGRACDGLGVSHLDLNSDGRFQESREELFIDHVHFNAHAHRLVAEILREELERAAPLP
jgi:hypothetical protein